LLNSQITPFFSHLLFPRTLLTDAFLASSFFPLDKTAPFARPGESLYLLEPQFFPFFFSPLNVDSSFSAVVFFRGGLFSLNNNKFFFWRESMKKVPGLLSLALPPLIAHCPFPPPFYGSCETKFPKTTGWQISCSKLLLPFPFCGETFQPRVYPIPLYSRIFL